MKSLRVPIYGCRLYMTTDRGEFEKHAGESMEGCDGAVSSHKNGVVLWCQGPEDVLAHECVHAAWGILEWVGVEVTSDNHEALAYLVGWIYERWQKRMKG